MREDRTGTGPQVNSAANNQTQYTYQYDQYGNWTEQTIVSRSQPDEVFRPGTVIRRKLTCY